MKIKTQWTPRTAGRRRVLAARTNRANVPVRQAHRSPLLSRLPLPRQDPQRPQRVSALARWARVGLKFAIVGVCGVLVNSAVLAVLYSALHLPLFPSSVVAVEMSIVSNYLLNDRWTFTRTSPSWRRFFKFNVACAGALAVTPTVVWLLHELGLHFLVANLIGIAAGAVLNFVASTLWVWGIPEGGVHRCSTSSSPHSSSSP
jgi:putative flippase GtrA